MLYLPKHDARRKDLSVSERLLYSTEPNFSDWFYFWLGKSCGWRKPLMSSIAIPRQRVSIASFAALSKEDMDIIIVIRNEMIVWRHGPHCWYFRLNLKYMGWSYRAYIKTAKNGNVWEELLRENDFGLFWPLSVVMNMVPKFLRQFRRLLQIKKSIANASRVL